jgi:hypothetical protein
VVIAVVAVRVMQVTGDHVVDVIVVLHDPMAAARSVDVIGVVAFTSVARRVAARGRVLVLHAS